VAIEEWSPDVVPQLIQKLKKWADHNPFNGEIKGGTLIDIRPEKIIVLSNYTIEQCFPRQEDYLPLSRRFKVINFPEGKQEARFRSQLVPIQTSPEPTLECDEIIPEFEVPTLEELVVDDDLIGDDLPTWDWSELFNTGNLSPLH